MLEVVDQLRRVGDLAVVSTLHDLAAAGRYADGLVLLDEGQVVATGPPPTVLTAGLIESVYAASVTVGTGRDGPPDGRPGPAGGPLTRGRVAGGRNLANAARGNEGGGGGRGRPR